jgi:glycosyltransferase involved in cell wall biosynthesis
LLIDVSIIATHDAGTGIQRVVRSILLELFESPPPEIEIKLIKATRKRSYVYAQDYSATLTSSESVPETPVVVEKGDIFLGLDLSSRILPRRQFDLLKWKRRGVICAFVVYDLLPALHPQWFTRRASRSFRHWLSTIAIHADALFCISHAVAAEAEMHLERHFQIDRRKLHVRWFHLGANSANLTESPDRSKHPVLGKDRKLQRQRVLLMVGTIEPRKGYAATLDAFELLWRDGHDIKLVIVGRQGWHVEDLATRLQTHPESGKRLQWICDADDAMLGGLYRVADGLIMASEAEGFGLPLVEAARYGVPLFVRDLEVFREVAGQSATYFSAQSGNNLAPQMLQWVNALENGDAIGSDAIAPLTWQASAEKLKELIMQLYVANA